MAIVLKDGDHSSQLNIILTDMYEKGLLCDLTIYINVVSPTTQLTVHKVVLCAASAWFMSLARDGGLEADQVLMEDMNMDSVCSLVQFCYTGELSLSSANIHAILDTAIKMDITSAVLLCRTYVSEGKCQDASLCASLSQLFSMCGFKEEEDEECAVEVQTSDTHDQVQVPEIKMEEPYSDSTLILVEDPSSEELLIDRSQEPGMNGVVDNVAVNRGQTSHAGKLVVDEEKLPQLTGGAVIDRVEQTQQSDGAAVALVNGAEQPKQSGRAVVDGIIRSMLLKPLTSVNVQSTTAAQSVDKGTKQAVAAPAPRSYFFTSTQTSSDKRISYTCTVCNVVMRHRSLATSHLATHASYFLQQYRHLNRYRSLCVFKFIKKHGTRYKCIKCGQRFAFYSQCRLHLLKSCMYSVAVQRTGSRIIRHMVCTKCDVAFAGRRFMHIHNLIYHQPMHRTKQRMKRTAKTTRNNIKSRKLYTSNAQHNTVDTTNSSNNNQELCAAATQLLGTVYKATSKEEDTVSLSTMCGAVYKDKKQYIQHLLMHKAQGDAVGAPPPVNKIQQASKPTRIRCKVTPAIKDKQPKITSPKPKKKLKASSSLFICAICGRMFNTSAQLNSHHKCAHNEERPYVCEVCNYHSKEPQTLQRHKWLKHNIMTEGLKLVQCEQCGHVATCNARLKDHMLRKHSNAKGYPCTMCARAYSTKYQLSDHVRQAHASVRYRCSVCGYTSPNHFTVRKHVIAMHSHPDLKPYQCQYCSFTHVHSGCVHAHCRRVHKGVPPKYVLTTALPQLTVPIYKVTITEHGEIVVPYEHKK